MYIRRLESAMRMLLAPSTGIQLIVLLQFPQVGPVPGWAEQTGAQDEWDDLARQAVEAFPGHALYISTEELLAPGGAFYSWLRTASGAWLRARKIDNVHFCPYGAAELGALMVDDLRPVLHLGPMRPGWEFGAWSHAARYNNPPGACPNDQPPPGYRGTPVPNGRA